MKKQILIWTWILVSSLSLRAQYYGGQRDGSAAGTRGVAPMASQSFYCNGGTADGYTSAVSALAAMSDQSVYCSGGNSDGYSQSSTSGYMFQGSLFCGGGNGDGACTMGSAVTPLGGQANYCSGGNGDGFTVLAAGPFFMSSQVVYCSGGNGDGYGYSSAAGAMFNSSVYCSGGNGDGYSSLSGSGALGGQSVYCYGGNGDGYGSLAMPADTLGNGIWKGITSTSWTTASNWTNNAVPDINTNVTIPPFVPFYPELNNILAVNYSTGTYKCKSLFIEPGAQITNTGALNIGGQMIVAGTYIATNNSTNSQNVFSGGTLALLPMGVIRLGNQSTGPAYCDLKINNGGTLSISGGILEVDDQLNLMNGGTFNMTGGYVFIHMFGEGSAYSASAPGTFYVQSTAAGTVSGGIIRVAGKTTSGSYSSVSVNSPSFGFTGDAALLMTNGISETRYDTEIRTVSGANLQHLLINKPEKTVSIATDATINGKVKIYPDSRLQINTGVTVTVADSVVLYP